MSSVTKVPRCVKCADVIWEPNDVESELLPAKWRSLRTCPACLIDEPGEPERLSPEERHETLVQSRLLASGLPEAFFLSRLSDLDVTEERKPVLAALEDWARGGTQSLFLCGDFGTGKTLMAASAARARLEHSPVQWVTAPQFALKARASFGSERLAEAEAIVSGRGALVLDDLGKENVTRSSSELLFATIDDRMCRNASLLITSNLKPSELGELHGSWLSSRLALMNAVRVLGRDRRLDAYVK